MLERYDKLLRSCRTKAGLTQRQLAKKAGISIVSVYNYENYKTIPTLDRIEAFLNACGFELEVREK